MVCPSGAFRASLVVACLILLGSHQPRHVHALGLECCESKRRETTPRLSRELEPCQQERSITHSQHSTSPSQRLFISEYSRRCCKSEAPRRWRREKSSNNGLVATHAASDNTMSGHAMLAAAARTTQTLAARHRVRFIGCWLEARAASVDRPLQGLSCCRIRAPCHLVVVCLWVVRVPPESDPSHSACCVTCTTRSGHSEVARRSLQRVFSACSCGRSAARGHKAWYIREKKAGRAGRALPQAPVPPSSRRRDRPQDAQPAA
jgi:hypothetical protein